MLDPLKYLLMIISIISLSSFNFALANDVAEYSFELKKQDLNSRMGKAPVIIELFSSQYCTFCPNADKFFNDLLENTNIIGVSCHVDYYSKDTDTLSKPFCSMRQKEYMKTISFGTYFTPQMIINGKVSEVGYKYDEMIDKIISISKQDTKEIEIKKLGENENRFNFELDAYDVSKNEKISIMIMLYNKPIETEIPSGRNKGKKIIYSNMIEKIEEISEWDGTKKQFNFSLDLVDNDAGFIVMVQNENTGNIIAVGEYIIQFKEMESEL